MPIGYTINKISLRNFRNYETLTREFDVGVNKIIGPNATGKTNIIEAISLMTQISSFRNAQTLELVNKNHTGEATQIEVEIFDMATETKNDFTLKIQDGKKTYKLNGKTKTISDCKGRFPSVIFTPDDLAFIKGSNTMRRVAVDSLGCQISPDYYRVLHDYNKALKQKNAMLRDGTNLDMLRSINDVLVRSGAQLVFYRLGLTRKILPVVANYYDEISGGNEKLNIEYYPS